MPMHFEKTKDEDRAGVIKDANKAEDLTRRDFLIKMGAAATLGLDFQPRRGWAETDVLVESRKNREMQPTRIHILYLSHTKPEELIRFRDRIKEADIYIPEGIGWSQEYLDDINAVSKGAVTPKEFLEKMNITPRHFSSNFYYFLKAELEEIYDSKKQVVFVDIPENSELFKRWKAAKTDIARIDFSRDFENTLVSFSESVKNFAAIQGERERHMLAKLQELTDRIESGELPKPQTGKEIRIFMPLGIGHTRIYHELKRSGKEASREFSSLPFTFAATGYIGEMLRYELFRKKTGKEFVARTLASVLLKAMLETEMFFGELQWPSKDASTLDLFLYRALNRISLEEIRQAFVKTRDARTASSTFFASTILRIANQKGIWLPRSERELYDSIGNVIK